MVGVSYKSVVSNAYRPTYATLLIWVGLLASITAYFVITKATESIFVPFVAFFAFVPLAFLLYLSPRRAANLVRLAQAKSIFELAEQQHDLVLERSDVAEVQVESPKIRILTKSGEWYFFATRSRNLGSSLSQKEIQLLLALFQKFCSEDPPINMFTKNKQQWTLAQR